MFKLRKTIISFIRESTINGAIEGRKEGLKKKDSSYCWNNFELMSYEMSKKNNDLVQAINYNRKYNYACKFVESFLSKIFTFTTLNLNCKIFTASTNNVPRNNMNNYKSL